MSTERSNATTFFRVFYRISYSVLFLLLLVLLAATPGDHIYQTVSNGKLGNVFVVGGTYVVTSIIALFIYASRLYTNRTALAAIPRPYLPIAKHEVSKGVYKMIVKNRQRSALIAYESRPHDLSFEKAYCKEANEKAVPHDEAKITNTVIPASAQNPPWGELTHPGWAPPASEDLSDVQFEIVVNELPNLIEAKAVSLAPPDPAFDFMSRAPDAVPPPDPQVVSVLQRPQNISLRDYLSHLSVLGSIRATTSISDFLTQYEYARFSSNALTEREFRALMNGFSKLLQGMIPLDHVTVQGIKAGDTSSIASHGSAQSSFISQASPLNCVSSPSLVSLESTGSIVHHDPP